MIIFNDTWLNQAEFDAAYYLRSLSLQADHGDSRDKILQPLHDKKTFFNPLLDIKTRCRLMEVYAYGDIGITLSLPGYSLTGMMLHLADTDFAKQQLKTIAKNQYRTFFAVTEKSNGTDVNTMQSTIHHHDGQWSLQADKCYVGKAASAQCGIVIARHHNSRFLQPVYLSDHLLKQAIQNKQCQREHLPFSAMRAAQMGRISIRQLPIPNDHLIGHHKQSSGVAAGSQLLLQTFNRMRPSVGAMAMGLTRALLDHIHIFHSNLRIKTDWQVKQHSFYQQHEYFRHQLDRLQQDPENTGIASSCKMIGYQQLMQTLMCLHDHLTPHLLCDPWIEKWMRDAWGIEFMEGIPAIQYQNILMNHIRQSQRNS